jgi:hypothetical protein
MHCKASGTLDRLSVGQRQIDLIGASLCIPRNGPQRLVLAARSDECCSRLASRSRMPDGGNRIHARLETYQHRTAEVVVRVISDRSAWLSCNEAGLVILGGLSIQGNLKPMGSLAEPLQVAMDNGARKALIPLENKRNFSKFRATS